MILSEDRFTSFINENFNLRETVRIELDGKEIQFNELSFAKIFTDPINYEKLKSSGVGSALLNAKVSYNHSSDFQKSSSVCIFDEEFSDWFTTTFRDRIFIPDTNFLISNIFSSLTYKLSRSYLTDYRVSISRLTIMELERIANQGSSGSEKKTDEKKSRRKREVMAAMGEIEFLKSRNASLLPYIEQSLFEGFSKYAGEHMMDSWIRREIHMQREGELFGKLSSRSKIVFATADLINSFAAQAEGIDTLYFSSSREGSKVLTVEQFSKFLISLSIRFESIKIGQNTFYQCDGIWQGKTPSEWFTNSIMITKC